MQKKEISQNLRTLIENQFSDSSIFSNSYMFEAHEILHKPEI